MSVNAVSMRSVLARVSAGMGPGLLMDLVVVLGGAWLIGAVLGWQFLLSSNWPTGGDSASHTLYLWTYARELLAKGQVTGWMPEVFGGFPFLSYYFPLSFMAIVALGQVLAEAAAIKVGMFAAALLMPGLAWLASTRWLSLPRPVALWGVLACLAFLLHEQNAIWGGNLLSTLAGEFTQSHGVLWGLLTLMAWQRCIGQGGQGWYWVALLEAATGFSNGFALLVTGFATGAFLFDRAQFWRNVRLLALGHGLAFFMLAGWLWPLFEMHGITIPNDALFEVTSWKELLPFPQAILLALGLVGAVGHALLAAVPAWRRALPWNEDLAACLRLVFFMANAALLSAVGFLAAGQLGLANIRFFPFAWLLGGMACAWLWGSLLWRLGRGLTVLNVWSKALLQAGLVTGFATVLSLNMNQTMDWALWNHSGLEPKPQWQQLARLFPTLKGTLESPRLLFEHDPANQDLGSTRTLEALPMFLGGRPVLEGLYMESALLSPAVYQLQSEVSRHPSSPLARFPSGSLDLAMAEKHMRFLWANEVLIRHPETLAAFRASPAFAEVASAPPFHVFRLKNFDTQMVDVVKTPVQWQPKANWMERSFAWFKSSQQFGQTLPVFSDGPPVALAPVPPDARLTDLQLTRHSIGWTSNAVGSAHLVRVSWHPKWKLVSKGQLLLAAPGFMLVIPQEPQVLLQFTETTVGSWGKWMSILAFSLWGLLVANAGLRRWFGLRRGPAELALDASSPARAHADFWPSGGVSVRGGSWLWPLLLAALALVLHLKNPERLYTTAWDLYRNDELLPAAQRFDEAYAARTSPAKKEEALFWAAKSFEHGKDIDTAMERYKKLILLYHGFWLPESLFTLADLAERKGDAALAQSLRQRLLLEFPNNPWTQKIPPQPAR